MTDREKLIALMVEAESLCAAIDCYDGAVCEYDGEINGCAAFRADHLLANGVVVREKGEWDDTGRYTFVDGSLAIRCNLCGAALNEEEWNKYHWHFCPNCGADMRKGENG